MFIYFIVLLAVFSSLLFVFIIIYFYRFTYCIVFNHVVFILPLFNRGIIIYLIVFPLTYHTFYLLVFLALLYHLVMLHVCVRKGLNV